jgi:succinoglycan biosynthesis transport protein ExoP
VSDNSINNPSEIELFYKKNAIEEENERLLPPIILQYWQTARRWRWVLFSIILASLVIGLVVTLITAPLYTSRSQIEINRQQKNITKVEGIEAADAWRDLEFYATQHKLLEAVSLAQRVERSLKLANDDSFFENHGVNPAETVNVRKRQAVQLLRRNVEISPIRNSRLVDVVYTSRSPAMSAKIANAWTREFIASNMDREFASTSDARQFLERRLEFLRARLEESERNAALFASNKDIVALDVTRDAEGKTQTQRTLASAKVEALNQALMEATNQRIAVESRATTGSKNSSEAINSPTISALRQRQGEVEAELAKLLAQFEPEYPAAKSLQEQYNALGRTIAREEGRLRASQSQAYQEAAQRERQVAAQFNAMKQDLDRQRRDTIQYNIYQREADTNRQLYDALLQRYKEIGVAGSVGASNIAVVDKAEPSTKPSAPNLSANLGIALLVGIGIAFAAVLALEQIDEGIRSPAEVWNLLKLPLLGNVPLSSLEPVDELTDVKSRISEAYFSIRSALAFSTTHGLPNTLAIVSTQPSEGKSTSAAALAIIIGRTGKSVLLVDADLRSPSVHHMVHVPNTRGFSNLLTGDNDVQSCILDTAHRGVKVLPTGPLPPSPSELLSSDRLAEIISRLRSEFDHVIFDAPPVLGLADAPLICRAVEGSVYVIEPGRAPVRGIRSSIQRIQMLGGLIFGVIVTKIDLTRQHYGYSYGYGYGYGYGDGYSYGSNQQENAPS